MNAKRIAVVVGVIWIEQTLFPPATPLCPSTGGTESATEPAAAQSQQYYGQVLAVGTKLAVTLDDLHFATVHQAGAAVSHPGFSDRLGDFGATFHRGQDLGVKPVDFLAEVVNIGKLINFHGL